MLKLLLGAFAFLEENGLKFRCIFFKTTNICFKCYFCKTTLQRAYYV